MCVYTVKSSILVGVGVGGGAHFRERTSIMHKECSHFRVFE